MSTIQIQFTAIGTGVSGGYVEIGFNDNNVVSQLRETSIDGPSVQYRFSQIPTSLPTDPDTAQAQAFAFAFNRDYKNVGGTNNLSAVSSGDTVTITTTIGTFDTFTQTGNFATNLGINNTPQADPNSFTYERLTTGDCTTINYRGNTATGGTGPYRISVNGSDVITGWDGASNTASFALNRGFQSAVKVYDSLSALIADEVVNVPRKLEPGEFKERATTYETYSDILIESVNPVEGTTPVDYSLDNQGASTGGNYQSSNTFPGVAPGTYELFVRDVYGCEVTKTIIVSSFQDATVDENPKYFEVMHGNSIIVSECPTFGSAVKKNFENTGSWNELAGINYDVLQYWAPSDYEGIQFKSSYPYHIITLHKCDGTKQDIAPIMIQENLGSKEKVDCKFFQISGQTAVYFDGGNEYTPDTTTIIGASEYTQFTPDWAEVGQLVFIDGLGGHFIESTGYDETLERGYFVINVTTSDTEGKVQVTFNKQLYNLFEVYIDFSTFTKGRLVFEKGLDFNNVDGNPYASEILVSQEDTDDMLLLKWSDPKNKGNIVFQSGIQFTRRMEGLFRPIFEGESETFAGDSREYSLKQTTYQNYRLEFDRLSAKEVYQLTIATGLDGFEVNNVPVVRKKYPEIEALGDSNYYSLKVDLAYSGDLLAIKPDETVLEVSTGVVGGGGTGKAGAGPVYDGLLRLNIDGGFVTVGEDFISV